MPAGVLFVDREKGFPIQANKKATELLGQDIIAAGSNGEYIRTYGLEREDGQEYPADKLPILSVLESGRSVHTDDLFVRRADGTRIRVEIHAAPVNWSGQEGFDAVVAMFRDITERKLNESKLEAEREFSRALIQNLSDGVVACNQHGQLIVDTSPDEKFYGVSDDAVSPDEWARHYGWYAPGGKRLLAKEETPLYRALHGDVIIEEEMVVQRGDRESRSVLVNCSPIRDPNGDLIGAVCVNHNITQIKKANEEAKRLAAMVEHSNNAIIGVSLDGAVNSWNRGAEEIYGYLVHEVIGQSVDILVPQGSRSAFHELLRRIQMGGGLEHLEDTHVAKGGQQLRISLCVSHVRDDTGVLIGMSLICQDIGQHRQEQEQLHREDKMRSIGTLAGGVAHDFNNILVSVLGNASLIQSEMPAGHEWSGPINTIVHSAERAAAITRQLLAYSRGGAFSPRSASLNSVITDSLPLCRSASGNNVVIEFEPRTSDDRVDVDLTQMQQIMLNLTVNAAEAMPDGGKISIITTPCSGPEDSPLAGKPCVCLYVKDEGHGIDSQIAEKVFEPFFTTKEFGRGLGLASVYGMLKNHGGEVRLISQAGEGAEFSIYFPLAVPAP